MKIWILDCDVDKYENLKWKGKIDLDYIYSFNGESKKENWRPIEVVRMYDREYSNTVGLSPNIPVFDRKAVDELRELLNNDAEILPLTCDDGDFFIINPIKVLDCIDYKRAEYKTFRDGKRIMSFKKYSFKEDIVSNNNIFRIIEEPLKRPFVSDEFRRKVMESGLSGFKFELAWDSDGNN